MNIYCINNENIIKEAEKGSNFINPDISVNDDDIVIVNSKSPIYYEPDRSYGSTNIIRKSNVIDGISNAEFKIFAELMSVYKEMSDISETINEFQNLSKEELDKSLSEILACVKRHNKISEKEERFLFDIFSGNKSKKQLLESGICTYDELQHAYYEFMNEMQWCYGFKKQSVEHRVSHFSQGKVEFFWTPSSFSDKYKIDSSILQELFKKLFYSTVIFEKCEKKLYFELLKKHCKKSSMLQEEILQLVGLSDKIILKFEEEYHLLYLNVAQHLIDSKKTNINDIHEYCKVNGYCKYEIWGCMKKLGVIPKHILRRRSDLY